ncbi:MAG: manganese efflux pump [Akkermansia sp.]|nr:manganese efflux pump [Akkermansia sp.]
MLEIIIIALALAVDATVYSFSYGLVLRCCRLRNSLWLALTVGAFQAGMPLLGYLGGEGVRDIVAQWQDGIVAAVFCGLGAYVIYGAWKGDEDECDCCSKDCNPLGLIALLLIGVATAIDALAVGVAMALGDIGGTNLSLPRLFTHVSIIGAVTFVCSLAAFHSARLLHHLPTRWLESIAGLLLIALGLKSLL